MDLLWPNVLLLLVCIPGLIAFYLWVLRGRRRFSARYSSLLLVDNAIHSRSLLRKHLPFVLFVGALASLTLALARPVTAESVFSGRTTIILTLDISRSMCMRDIEPNRMEAARAAALSFVRQPVIGTQVGVVAFAGFAELAQKPTTNLALLESALLSLTTATETAIGSAILRALDAIAEVDPRVAPSEDIPFASTSARSAQPSPDSSRADPVSHIIVLLTDGASNSGPPPLEAARQAAGRGVRIFPIGFGTTNSAIMDCWNLSEPASLSRAGSTGFGNGPDEATLKEIADMTGGEFYSATSAAELQLVFQRLHQSIALANQSVEVSVFFAALGVVLAMMALILAVLWHPVL
jgi:Ca-activated chloride channel family protein